MTKELFIQDKEGKKQHLDFSQSIINGLVKASMMKEALASCQMEGIGLDLSLEELYLAELGYYKTDKIKREIEKFRNSENKKGSEGK